MRHLLQAFLICLLVPISVAVAQEDPSTTPRASSESPLTAHNQYVYRAVKTILLRTAETMPEKNYAFRPADTVRTFGQIVGHVADTQYAFCATVLGEKNPTPNIEKTKTSKSELVEALAGAFAYCDRAYDGMTDASATGTVRLMGTDAPKLGVLTVNIVHTIEHYGNLVTYMRMNDIIPPTSDPEFMRGLQKR